MIVFRSVSDCSEATVLCLIGCLHFLSEYVQRPICGSEFFPPSHLCLVVYMYPTPIVQQVRGSDFFDLGPKKSDCKH